MNLRKIALALTALAALTAGAAGQARPPRQQTGPITIFGEGSTGDGSGFCVKALGSSVCQRLERIIGRRKNVEDYPGWDPTGATDSYPAIQAAIDALPASGGVVEGPCGSTPKITQTLNIHNGTASSYTTRNGTRFESTCAAPSSWSFSGAVPPASVPNRSMQITWAGPAGGTMMKVNGGDGWGVQDVVFDCANTAGVALKIVSASTGDSRRLSGLNCKNSAFLSTTVPGITVSGQTYKADSLRNHYTQIYVLLADGGRAFVFDGDRTGVGPATSDTDFNLVENIQVQDKGVNGSTPGAILFGQSDSNIVRNLQCTLANSSSRCITYDAMGPHGDILPGSNVVDMVDWGAIPTEPVNVLEEENRTLQAFNYITNVLHVNGGDTRLRLHPKIFMSDNSISVTDETIQLKRITQKAGGHYAVNVYFDGAVYRYHDNGPGMLWDYNPANNYFQLYTAPVNTAGKGAVAALSSAEIVTPGVGHQFVNDVSMNSARVAPKTVGTLPPCTPANEGQMFVVIDASGPSWANPLVGGGASRVGARCNSVAWAAY